MQPQGSGGAGDLASVLVGPAALPSVQACQLPVTLPSVTHFCFRKGSLFSVPKRASTGAKGTTHLCNLLMRPCLPPAGPPVLTTGLLLWGLMLPEEQGVPMTLSLTSDSSSIFMLSICRRSNKVPGCSAEENFSGTEGRKANISGGFRVGGQGPRQGPQSILCVLRLSHHPVGAASGHLPEQRGAQLSPALFCPTGHHTSRCHTSTAPATSQMAGPAQRRPGPALQSAEAELAEPTAAAQGAGSVDSNPSSTASWLCDLGHTPGSGSLLFLIYEMRATAGPTLLWP